MPDLPSPAMSEALATLALRLAFYVSGFGQKCCYLHPERRDHIEEVMQKLLPLFPEALADFDRIAAAAIDQHSEADARGALTMFLARLKDLSQYSDGTLLSTQLIGDSYFDTPA